MWILSILLGLSLSNMLMADMAEDLQNCGNLTQLAEMQIESLAKMDRDETCLIIPEFFECVDNVVETNTGFKIAVLANMLSGTPIGKMSQVFINVKNLFQDFCRAGSPIYIRYKEHIACFITIEGLDTSCNENAEAAFEAYSVLEEARGNLEDCLCNKPCIVQAYKSACYGAIINNSCGQSAFNFYQDLIKRTGLFRGLLCSPQALTDLKTKFARSLDLRGTQRRMFLAGLNLRKRK